MGGKTDKEGGGGEGDGGGLPSLFGVSSRVLGAKRKRSPARNKRARRVGRKTETRMDSIPKQKVGSPEGEGGVKTCADGKSAPTYI